MYVYCFCVHAHHVTSVLEYLQPLIKFVFQVTGITCPHWATQCHLIHLFYFFVALFILNDSQPPIVPKLSGDGDISNFETYPESELDKTPSVSDKDLETFKNF